MEIPIWAILSHHHLHVVWSSVESVDHFEGEGQCHFAMPMPWCGDGKKGGRYCTGLGQFSLIVCLKHLGAMCHLQSLFCIFNQKPSIPTPAAESATQQNKDWSSSFKWRFQGCLYVHTRYILPKASQEDGRDWLLVNVRPSNDSMRNSAAFALSRARQGCHARLLQEEGRGERICQGSIWLNHERGRLIESKLTYELITRNWTTSFRLFLGMSHEFHWLINRWSSESVLPLPGYSHWAINTHNFAAFCTRERRPWWLAETTRGNIGDPG